MTNQQIVANASSGVIKDFYASWDNSIKALQESTPAVSLDLVLDMSQKDATLKAALTTLVDGVLGSGHEFMSTNKQQLKRLEKLMKDVRFSRVLRKAVYNLVLYGNSFIEIVRNRGSKSVKELHLLETTTMKIKNDAHGEIKYYYQDYQGSESIKFSTKDVIHISLSNITTKVWGDVDIRAIMIAVANKQYLSKYLNWYLATGKFRDQIQIPSGVSEKNVKSMMAHYKEGEQNATKPFIAIGGKDSDKIEVKALREFPDMDSINKGLERYDREILMLLQVPPIMVGVPDNSNRSGSVTEMDAFYMRLKGIQEVLKDEFDYEFFPKIDFEGCEIIFNSLDKRNDKDDMLIAVQLNSLQVSRKQIEYFLQQSGIEFKDGPLFDEYDRMAEIPQAQGGQVKDAFPSRAREDKKTMPKHEIGKDSTTRQEQLVARGYTPMEVEDIMRNL